MHRHHGDTMLSHPVPGLPAVLKNSVPTDCRKAMITMLRALTMAVLLISGTSGNAQGKEEPGFHYHVKARIDPAVHKLEAEVLINNPPSAKFYLQPGFSIRKVAVNGKESSFHRNVSPESSLYSHFGHCYSVDAETIQELAVKYCGEIPRSINRVNMISAELVELALYSAWYPLFAGTANYTFDIQVDMPDGFLVVTNAMLEKQWRHAERSITRWKSSGPSYDMVIIASPFLHKIEGGNADSRIELYYRDLPERFMKTQMEDLTAGITYLSSIYGPLEGNSLLRFVHSPRSGWGYSRIPLVVVSEERAREQIQKEKGDASAYHGLCHETAHFWWHLADVDSPDDWINEGLAEYSAFRLSEKRFGRAFSESLVKEYRQHAKTCRTVQSIAETEGDSPDRYINRYEKTTLMFIEARTRFGEQALDRLLNRIHARSDGKMKITTSLFLEAAGKELGEEAKEFFREVLYRKGETEQPVR